MKLNKYEVTYKNGSKRTYEAFFMGLKGDKVYQIDKDWRNGNLLPCCFPSENVASIECVEKNNNLTFEVFRLRKEN